ncbi:aldo/keto reductase [Polyangium jinanense]|uniref:Aldo/keto reductase n=1 Tax=Polyangium jinanense TaxID=2829994 RepID=A0A9X3XDT0_9BACT|nr:aldo/keto reductase [Polyangium jinanense]MDC3962063.1 aldo/keto reductase [Polyangium jinanense]MDC3988779.1 aldo/keto reductase [Polyangium jinanense]
MSASFSPVRLGRSPLDVVPLGLAASYGAKGRDVEHAFERGINFFYWGSSRMPDFGEGLKRLGKRSRERIKVVIQTYSRSPAGIGKSLEKGLRKLEMDHADVLLLGWWNLPPKDAILDAAADLVRRGRARSVMISCHNRPAFKRLARDPRIDLLMLRYNAAHPGADKDVFPHLPDPGPGIVSYTSTSWGQLLDRKLVPAEERLPRAADCYRFALSNPNIGACWAGARDAAQIDEALKALEEGPMNEEELAWMRRIGERVRETSKLTARGMGFADRLVNLYSGFGFRTTTELGEG